MEENKLVLREKFETARKMGMLVNSARGMID